MADLTTLDKMRQESEETEQRCTEVADETKSEGVEMMRTYLGEGSDELDGFEFLIMTEAGEAGHWAILAKVNEKANDGSIRELTGAADEDPDA